MRGRSDHVVWLIRRQRWHVNVLVYIFGEGGTPPLVVQLRPRNLSLRVGDRLCCRNSKAGFSA